MRLVFTSAAVADLDAIASWIAQDNPSRALGFVKELRAACFEIVDFPKSYPLVPRYAEFKIHKKAHGNYLIFYQIGMDAVEIIHILHGARDYELVLFPGPQT